MFADKFFLLGYAHLSLVLWIHCFFFIYTWFFLSSQLLFMPVQFELQVALIKNTEVDNKPGR
jgi:hypothetical protein